MTILVTIAENTVPVIAISTLEFLLILVPILSSKPNDDMAIRVAEAMLGGSLMNALLRRLVSQNLPIIFAQTKPFRALDSSALVLHHLARHVRRFFTTLPAEPVVVFVDHLAHLGSAWLRTRRVPG
jgi:hypothetical protein